LPVARKFFIAATAVRDSYNIQGLAASSRNFFAAFKRPSSLSKNSLCCWISVDVKQISLGISFAQLQELRAVLSLRL
jgi:hypothetical protein